MRLIAFMRLAVLRKYGEQSLESSVSCDVILNPKVIRFLPVDKLGAGFRLSKQRFSSVKKANSYRLSLITTPS